MLHVLPISLFTYHSSAGNYYVLRPLDVFRSCKIIQVHAFLHNSSLQESFTARNYESISLNVQRDATNAIYIVLHYHTTCFGCRPHPLSGVRKTVVTATGTSHMIVHLPQSNVAKWPRWTEVAARS